MKIVFATNNVHKLSEIRNSLHSNALDQFDVVSLVEMGINETIPETQTTLRENAIQKADYINKKYSINCFADDTGLEVKVLNNRPGVFSARYAGEDCSYEDNVNKLLHEMKGCNNREARFCTVIALILEGKIHTFEGIIEGTITQTKIGDNGFGYDPVFVPKGYKKTFAEMSLKEKNQISHRAIALSKLIRFLSENA